MLAQIQQNMKSHCIDVYPQKCFDEDINDRILNSKIRVRVWKGEKGRARGGKDQGTGHTDGDSLSMKPFPPKC